MNMFIYKIITGGEFYIGSTCNLNLRINQHRYCCNKIGNKKYNLPLYKYIRENGGFDKIKFEIILIIETLNLDQQKIEEQKIIDDLKPTLNTHNAFQEIKNKIIYDNLRYENSKILCECCNKKFGKYNLKRHKTTKKYFKYINSLNE